MHFEYILYVLTEVYCLIFAFTILLRLDSSMGSEHEVRQLKYIIYSYFGLIISDIFWASVKYQIIHPIPIVNLIGNMGNYIFVALSSFCWCRYIETKVSPDRADKKSYNILMMLPICTLLLLDVSSIFTKWIIYIDEAGQCRPGPFEWVHWIVDIFYVVIPTFAAIGKAIHAHSKYQRREYMRYTIYFLILVPGVVQAIIPGTSIFALNEFMVINVLFLTIQSMQIYDDALTGLNNRRRLIKYLDECLKNASEDSPVVFFIIDINSFKQINDSYGHVEGDNALRRFADVLRKLSVKYDAFIARYAGDEFCIVITGESADPEDVIKDLEIQLRDDKKLPEGRKKGYVITASCGYFVCDTPESDADKVIERADEMLYKRKREWHNS
jgi:diguanylate cyclase (GGDEF)-like protein